MYWRVRYDALRYKVLVDNGSDYGPQDFLQFEDARAVDNKRLKFKIDRQRALPTSDFLPHYDGILVSSAKVFAIFADEINKSNHVFYDGKHDFGAIRILSILDEVSGFDFEKSEYRLFEDGDIETVHSLKLQAGFQCDLDMFRLNDSFGTRFELIVSDRFKNKYEDHNLTGLIFEPTS